MLRARLALALVALLALAPAAHATTLVLDDGTAGPQPYQSWVDAARMPTPAGSVLLRLDTCSDLVSLACAAAGDRVIDADPGWLRPHILLHELGHVFDQDMAPWAREAFAAIIHRHDPWSGPLESSPPSEQFAEAYALCARHPRIRRTHVMGYHYSPTPAQHRAVCALIRSAAP